MQTAVKFDNVSKVYKTYEHPVHRLLELMTFSRVKKHGEVHALQPLSLEIPKGVTFGVLGRNGSGKSTLLQLLCSVLEPTTGTVAVHGRVTALLELGSGFNPDFSGRENVYMYSSILGLTHQEVERRFSAIVDFSGIGDFIHRPVRTYSSGMMLRLAFSVAISIDPDIFVVDEALAVGDARFQQKCMRRMREIMNGGATVIFVSHDIGSVKLLCSRAMLLDQGRFLGEGDSADIARAYHRMLFEEDVHDEIGEGSDFGFSVNRGDILTSAEAVNVSNSSPVVSCAAPDPRVPDYLTVERFRNGKHLIGTGEARILLVQVFDARGQETSCVEYKERFTIRVYYEAQRTMDSLVVGVVLRNSKGLDVLATNTRIEHKTIQNVASGESFCVDFQFENILRDDHYSISPAIIEERYFHQSRHCEWLDEAFILRVVKARETIVYGLFYPTDMQTRIWRSLGRNGEAKEVA